MIVKKKQICQLRILYPDTYRLNARGWKKILDANGNDKKMEVAVIREDKIDFKVKAVPHFYLHYYLYYGYHHPQDQLWTVYDYFCLAYSSRSWVIQELTQSHLELPWWLSDKELACQCRRQFWSLLRKIPHGLEQLSPCTTTTGPVRWSPGATTAESTCCNCRSLHAHVLHKERSHRNKKPIHHS